MTVAPYSTPELQRQTRPGSPRAPVLYALVAAPGEVLYVGHSTQLLGRLHGHRFGQPWWGDVAWVSWIHATPYPRVRARIEGLAIMCLKPKHNIVGNQWEPIDDVHSYLAAIPDVRRWVTALREGRPTRYGFRP